MIYEIRKLQFRDFIVSKKALIVIRIAQKAPQYSPTLTRVLVTASGLVSHMLASLRMYLRE